MKRSKQPIPCTKGNQKRERERGRKKGRGREQEERERNDKKRGEEGGTKLIEDNRKFGTSPLRKSMLNTCTLTKEQREEGIWRWTAKETRHETTRGIR